MCTDRDSPPLGPLEDAVSYRPTPSGHSKPFYSGLAGYYRFRTPALMHTPRGLLAFAEARMGVEDSGQIGIVFRQSLDAGTSWGRLRAITEALDLDNKSALMVGNPVPLFVPQKEVLLLVFCSNGVNATELEIRRGLHAGQETRRRIWITRSYNDGSSWSKPVELTPSVTRRKWTWLAVGPGGAIQLRNGTLVVPANFASKAISDDPEAPLTSYLGRVDHSYIFV